MELEYEINIATKNPIDNFIDELKEKIGEHEDVIQCTVQTFGECGKCKHRNKAPQSKEGGYCPLLDDYVAETDDCETGNFELKDGVTL